MKPPVLSPAAAGVALMLAGVGAFANDDTPVALRPPTTQLASLELLARGVQIYGCKRGASGVLEWTLQAPEAELVDARGKHAGTHSAGPTWAADDGSVLVGKVKARGDAPDASAIPWLLLDATSTGGAGVFAGVRSIVRLHTVGGKAPAAACRSEQQTARVPYRATYRFYADAASAGVAQRDGALAVPIEYAGLFPNEFAR